MRYLIIHPKDQTTDFLKPIYTSFSNKTVISGGISKVKLRELIKNHDRVIMLDHGTPHGLLSVNQLADAGPYIIDSSFSDLLSEKSENIFIWCHADQFIKQNELNDF